MSDRQYVLVAVETAHIQPYIFASNRLKENVGASYLVAAATGLWALETLEKMQISVNLTGDNTSPFTDQRIEDGHVDAEIIYFGGGTIVVLFAEQDLRSEEFSKHHLPSRALSRQFIRRLSTRVLVDAPGLKLTFSVAPFSWDEQLSHAVADLLTAMKAQRAHQPALIGDGGLGVNIMGASTSMPAIDMQKDPDDNWQPNWQPYAAETVAKRAAAEEANRVLRQTLGISRRDYRFALELDDLGRSKEDTSYIAVVHADGNGLGNFIQALTDNFPADMNREYISYMRWFSQGVKEVAQRAQRDMVASILASVYEHEEDCYLVGLTDKATPIKLERRDGQTILPIRPLVSGGDDVTFVCDGRIGIDLAVVFLESFEKYSLELLEESLTACAGVAIVKTHYPFSRAYDLADELAGSAKQARFLVGKDAPSAIDWHITAGGLYGNLDTMRQREYEVEDGSLTLRPLFVGDIPRDHTLYRRSWTLMQNIITQFQRFWSGHQNKAEKLRAVLRKGPIETAIFNVRYLSDSDSPKLPIAAGFENDGWVDGFCGYYDALELLDKYIPLQSQEVRD